MSAPLRRSELAERTLLTLQRGRGTHPDVLLVEGEQGLLVVKDYAHQPRWLRATVGRRLIDRELRAHRALEGHPAVPRCLGRLDPFALVLEHRGGTRISGRRPWTFSPAFARELREAVRGLHQRGVVHLDLSHRGNVRADPAGRPVLLDFTSAVTLRPGGALARALLPLLALADRRALRKWERRVALAAGPGQAGSSGGSQGRSRPR